MEHKSLIDYIVFIIRGRKFIIAFTFILAVIAIVYSLVTPVFWKSSTKFKAKSSSSALNLDMLGNLSSMIPSGIGDMFGAGSESQQDMLNYLNSRSFSEQVIKEFDLISYFEIEEADSLEAIDKALYNFGDLVSVGVDQNSQLIFISAETKDKLLSKNICTFMREEMVEFISEKKKKESEKEYLFLQGRMAEYEQQASIISDQLLEFQRKNKIISLEPQIQQLIVSYSDMVAKKILLDTQKDQLVNLYGADNPTVRLLIDQSNLLDKKITEFETKDGLSDSEYLIGLSSLPEISVEYANIYIQSQILEKVITTFYPLLESAKFSYLKDAELIEVIDYERISGMKSKPKRAIIVIVVTFLSCVFSVILSIVWYSQDEKNRQNLLCEVKKIWKKKC